MFYAYNIDKILENNLILWMPYIKAGNSDLGYLDLRSYMINRRFERNLKVN